MRTADIRHIAAASAVAIMLAAGTSYAQTPTSTPTSTPPGGAQQPQAFPNTGSGGGASETMMVLAVSGLLAAGSAAYLWRSAARKR